MHYCHLIIEAEMNFKDTGLSPNKCLMKACRARDNGYKKEKSRLGEEGFLTCEFHRKEELLPT